MTDTPDNPGDGPKINAKDGAKEGDRIAKLLARAGIASRREVERMIADGRVRLNDVVLTTPATILTSLHGVTVDGKPVRAPEPTRLYAFHKPAGLITAERDLAGRPTIYDALRNALPPGSPRVMPVGRLDLNTEGLLLLTNDGELKRAMELPSSGVPRTYRARTFGEVTQAQLEELMEGIEVEGVRYGSINANLERSTGRNQWIELTLTEGKNREVRRVLEHLGLQVSRLIRIGYGPFYLDDLPRGMAVPIVHNEVEKFRKTLKLAPAAPGAARADPAAPRVVRAAPADKPVRPAPADRRPARSASPRRKPDPSRPDESAGRRPAPRPAPAPRAAPAPRRGRKEDETLLTRSELPARKGGRSASRQPHAQPPREASAKPRSYQPRDTSSKPYGQKSEPRGEGRPQRDDARPQRGDARPQGGNARPQGGANWNASGSRTGGPPRTGGGGPGNPARPGRGPAGGRGGKRK